MHRYSVSVLLGLAGAASAQASVVITMQPVNQIVLEWREAVFEVGAVGISPLHYQWERDHCPIPGAISASYTTPPVRLGDDGSRFTVLVSDVDSCITSADARLTVIPDVAPPYLVAVEPLPTLAEVLVRFNEPVDVPSASDPFNYQVSELPSSEPVRVFGCWMPGMDQTQLELGPGALKRNTDYRLEVRNVKDLSGNLLSYAQQTFHVPIPEPIPGDANGDGKVDDQDASILAANWLTVGMATWAQGDFNGDAIVDDLDASILAANWQAGVGAAVPEPTALALLLSALLAAGALAPRGRK